MSKIAVIGGGSVIWSRKLVADICLTDSLHGSEVALVDIDESRLLPVAKLCRRMSDETGARLTITHTLDRRSALKNADFVIVMISVGGGDARLQDLDIPWSRFNILQTVGDTIGPGGIFRFFRHIPVLMEIARDIQDICPHAWVIQLSNPLTPLCMALESKFQLNMIGYCHGVQGTEHYLAKHLGLERDSVSIYGYGINHFLFVKSMLINGRPGLHILEENEELLQQITPANYELWRTYGLYPINIDRHPAEFVPFFLGERSGYGQDYLLQQDKTRSVIEKSKLMPLKVEEELRNVQPLKISHSESIATIMEALRDNRNFVVHVNVRNKGAILNLPHQCNVEVPALINGRGVHPFAMGELPSGIAGLVRRVVDEQELMVEAALTGSRELAVQALAADALVQDIRVANQLFDAMYEAQKSYLPRFD
jgi:alpha-galactosidase